MNSDEKILSHLKRTDFHKICNRALWTNQHFDAASTGDGVTDNDVESPHNYIHNACGYPMTTASFAAFHPIFFLHHCNVDRLYEAYIQCVITEFRDCPMMCKQSYFYLHCRALLLLLLLLI